MKYPPRDAYRCRPPFETQQQALLTPRYLLAIVVVLGALTLAVAGALSADGSPSKAPGNQHSSFSHTLPYSPLPTSGGFQYLGDPQPSPSQTGALSLSSPSPSARLQVERREVVSTPPAALYPGNRGNPSPVQVWSQAAVLTPDGVPPAVDQVAPPTNVGSSLPTYNPNAGNLQGDPLLTTPTPIPQATSTPLPTAIPTPRPTPTPTPVPSSTPPPQPSVSPAPQPSATAGSQGSCVPTKHHPCRGGSQ